MGVHPCPCRQLASGDMDFSYARLPVLWFEPGWTSSHQCSAPHRDDDPALPGSATDDWLVLAERICGGGFCHSSLARGIGRVGSGAKRCAQRPVLHAGRLGVRPLCAPAIAGPLRTRAAVVCRRPHVQADPGHPALRAVAARLLAAESLRRGSSPKRQLFPNFTTADPGKAAAARTGPSIERGHTSCSERFAPDVRGHSSFITRRQCLRFLCARICGRCFGRWTWLSYIPFRIAISGRSERCRWSCWSEFRRAFFSCGVVAIS